MRPLDRPTAKDDTATEKDGFLSAIKNVPLRCLAVKDRTISEAIVYSSRVYSMTE